MSNVVHMTDPFLPRLNPIVFKADRQRIDAVLRKQGLIKGRGKSLERLSKFAVALNDKFMLQADWCKKLKDTDTLVIINLPERNLQLHGDGFNPMRMVLQIAVAVAAFYTAGTVGAAYSAVWGSVAAAAVMVVGNLIIGALLPMKQPGMSEQAQGRSSHMIGNAANTARLHQPKPVWYGHRRGYPDLAAMPYSEMSNNSMYLHQLFVLTQGKLQIDGIYIEKTPIDNYQEVEYQIVAPGQSVTLFPDNVYTAQEVQDLKLEPATTEGNDIIGHQLVVDTKTLIGYQEGGGDTGVDRPIYKYTYKYIDIKGKLTWFGGYVATPSGVKTTRLAIDLSWPKGLAYFNKKMDVLKHRSELIVEARLIDDLNNSLGVWQRLTKSPDLTDVDSYANTSTSNFGRNQSIPLSESVEMATLDGQLRTLYFDVPLGRYEVRMARTSKAQDKMSSMEDLHWIGLRSYMPSVRNYSDVTLLAVKIRATNNINNNIARRINVVGTRILPVYTGTTWVEQPTTSIAWAVADVFKNTIYGRKMTDGRLNLQELMRLDAVWSARDDTCAGLFDTNTTVWEAATALLRCGRAQPVYYMGLIDFYRNEPKSIPVGMFTPDSILKDSFNVSYRFYKPNEHDHIVVEYTDPVTWTTKEVICALPDSEMRKSLKLSHVFITSRKQAWREGIHAMAAMQTQREFTSFTTDREGMIPKFGDCLVVAHDVLQWGDTGCIDTIDGNVITVTESLNWQAGANHAIRLRGRKGEVLGTYPITRIDEFSGRTTGLPPIDVIFNNEPTHYIFGPTERVGSDVIMMSGTPNESEHVALSCVNYSDYPHQVENILTMPPEGVPVIPDVSNLTIANITLGNTLIDNLYTLTASNVMGAVWYEFEVKKLGVWIALQSSSSNSITTELPYGNIQVRARATNNTTTGAWLEKDLTTIEVTYTGSPIAPLLSVKKTNSVNGLPVYADIEITGVPIENVEIYVIEENGVIIYTGFVDVDESQTIRRQFVPNSNNSTVTFKAYGVDNRDLNSAATTVNMVY